MIRFFNVFKIIVCVAFLCVLLSACHKVIAYRRVDHLYFNDGTKYVVTSGLYDESDTVIGKTEEGSTIYEVVGDPAHNYVVDRSFLDNRLYVREDYEANKTEIEALILHLGHNEYIYEKEWIDILMTELMESEEYAEFDPDHEFQRAQRLEVYVKYPNDAVGEYCGSILYDGTEYWFVNFKDSKKILIGGKIKDKLAEYEQFNSLKQYASQA